MFKISPSLSPVIVVFTSWWSMCVYSCSKLVTSLVWLKHTLLLLVFMFKYELWGDDITRWKSMACLQIFVMYLSLYTINSHDDALYITQKFVQWIQVDCSLSDGMFQVNIRIQYAMWTFVFTVSALRVITFKSSEPINEALYLECQ